MVSSASFISALKKSGLIEPDRVQELLDQYAASGVSTEDASILSQRLVADGHLTDWQASKLLQGKHKGFLLGKYRLLALLGRGGMSAVYLAEHTVMRRRCAIKVLPTKLIKSQSYLERFYREARAVASLDHPNIVRAYDVDCVKQDDGEVHFLVMEYVEGQSLLALVRGKGPLSYAQCADYMRQAAEGLAHAHRAGFVHRDVKPGNLLVTRDGVVKILDLGLARYFHESDESSITVHREEGLLGTVDYLAPEQALDSHAADFRADIYGLGCTAFFALTGHPPFATGPLPQRLLAHQTQEPPPISADRPDVPESLEAIIRRMMRKKPEDRYQTAAEVAEAFARWLAENVKARGVAEAASRDANADIATREAVPEPDAPPRAIADTSDPTVALIGRPVDTSAPPSAEEPETVQEAVAEPVGVSGEFPPFPTLDEIPAWASRITGPPLRFPAFDQLVASVRTGRAAVPDATPWSAIGDPAGPQPPVWEDAAETTITDSVTAVATQRRARKRKKERSRSLRWKLTTVFSGTALLVVCAVMLTVMPRRRITQPATAVSSSGTEQTLSDTAAEKGEAASGSEKASPRKKPLGAALRLLTVGPKGKFPTIAEALDYLRDNKDAYVPRDRRDAITIQITASGTLAERIQVDNSNFSLPRLPIQIIGVQEPRPVLSPPGEAPIITIQNVERLIVARLDLNAEKKPVAVRLEGSLQGSRLSMLRISGFTESGIHGSEVEGFGARGGALLVDHVEIQGEPGSVALRFQGRTRHVHVTASRILGPARAGLAVDGETYSLEVRETTFAFLDDAVRFEGRDHVRSRCVLANNTFYKVKRGIVFTHMPARSGTALTIVRNLFASVPGPEVVVENDFSAEQFYLLFAPNGIEQNWSDRPKPQEPLSGEYNVILQEQQRLTQPVSFVSTEPSNEKFLKPLPENAFTQFKAPPGDFAPYIGAVEP